MVLCCESIVYLKVMLNMPGIDKKRIVIFGAYGGMNCGDEAILSSILQMLEEVGLKRSQVIVASYNPEHTKVAHRVTSVITSRNLVQLSTELKTSIKCCDLVVIGGGQIILDSCRFPNPWTSLLAKAGMVCKYAKNCNKRVFLWGIGVENVKSIYAKHSLAILRKADIVTVRDDWSFEILHSYGFCYLHLVADPAFTLSNGDCRRGDYILKSNCLHNVNVKAKKIALALTHTPGGKFWNIAEITKLVRQLRLRDITVFFVASEVRDGFDIEIARKIGSKNVNIVKPKYYNEQELADMMSSFDVLIASRMHCIIMSVLSDVKVIPIITSPKMKELAKKLKIPNVFSVDFNPSQIYSVLLDYLDESNRYPTKRIRKQVTNMAQEARLAAKYLLQCLQGIQ